MRPFHLLQITDCHLGSQPGEQLLGLDTDESFRDVLQLLKTRETPDIIVASGDISNDSLVPSYERFIAFVREYFPTTPLAWLPGNHDDPTNMDLVEELPIEAHYQAAGWNLIFLDSRIPMEEGGDLNPDELLRLEAELSKHADVPTLIFLHHQIVNVGSAWVDQYAVRNNDLFFDIIDRFDNVKAVSWGHVHQEFSGRRKDVALYATPSTCVQFVPNQDEFQVHRVMPGYRSFRLYPDGSFTTEVHRIKDKAYSIDFEAKGY
ncbi:3',5'-cyclic-AMP phosphodiesterase [Agarilytica rhodophyticola]|uniref:3',5'-cyclic-AMP phosphodiesterase n=1 Tax=Agarilytica rhodophyticola TaxID=1737490 RepID=UPI000B3466BE|nr:3',5'-cyclic-AMP phosphodiesterase [Agarilytica rhodophyticola]